MTNHHCCVPGCGADSRKDTNWTKYKFLKGVTFHGFPRDNKLRRLWLELIQRDDFDPSRYARICSLHFVGKRGPTETHPCPTLFKYNEFTGQVSEDLSAQIEAIRNKKTIPIVPTVTRSNVPPNTTVPAATFTATAAGVATSVVAPAAATSTTNTNIKPPQATAVSIPLPKNLPPNTKLLKVTGQPGSTIMIDGKPIQLGQLSSDGQIKVIKTTAGGGAVVGGAPVTAMVGGGGAMTGMGGAMAAMGGARAAVGMAPTGNPYQFINENTDNMWQMRVDEQPMDIGGAGSWKLEPDENYKSQESKTGISPKSESKKRKREESDEEEEESGSEEEGSSSEEEEEEEEGNDFEDTVPRTQIKKEKKESNGRAVVIQEGVEIPANVMDQINRPPLAEETQEVARLRERLILRGPYHDYMPKARCKYCDLFFANIHSLLDHIYRHTTRPYQCVECGETFEKSQEMEDHIECHSAREVEVADLYSVGGVKGGFLFCPLVGCDWYKRSEHIRDFAQHMRRHDPGNCVLCGEGLHGASEAYFVKHLKKHLPYVCRLKCPLCPENSKQSYFAKNKMKIHMQEAHKNRRLWFCYHCEDDKPVSSFAELDLHLLKSHSSNPYECQYCGAAYPSLFGLRSHARKHHQRGKVHDDKYQWIAVIRSRQNKGVTLSSSRKSKIRKEVAMMPQMGDRLFPPMTPQVVNLIQKQGAVAANSKTMSVAIPPNAANNIMAALGKGKITVPTEITGSAAIQMMNLIQGQVSEDAIIAPLPIGAVVKKPLPKLLPKPMMRSLDDPNRPRKILPPSAKMLAASAKRQAEAAERKAREAAQIQAAAAAAAAAAMTPPPPPPPPKPKPTPLLPPKPTVPKSTPKPTPKPPPKQQQPKEKKYRPQKVFIPQKDGTLVSKTILLPVDEPEDENELMTAIPIDSEDEKSSEMSSLMGLSSVVPTPRKIEQSTHEEDQSDNDDEEEEEEGSGEESDEGESSVSASSHTPAGISLDNSVLESLGISSQDLELGPVTETDESLGFTITEVRGDIDFGALPDDASAIKESEPTSQVYSLQEDEEDRAVRKVTCPYKDCDVEFDTAVGFWRQHYLKQHFKRSDMYEYMCRDCGELVYSWDWPPQDHDCPNPRWACICADCGDIFENMKRKNAHYPDCLTFQKYAVTPGTRPATTVITAHTCLYCTSALKSVAHLCQHLRTSHVSRRFNSLNIHCSLCSHYPTFSQAGKLWDHYKNSHQEWFMTQPAWLCSKCGEAHESEYDLTKHVIYTHAEEIKPSFLCNKCPFVFATSMLYNMHKEVAHKNVPRK